MSSVLAIASVGLLAAAAHLRSRAAGRAGSSSVKNVGALSNADIEGQIWSGVDPGEIFSATAAVFSGVAIWHPF